MQSLTEFLEQSVRVIEVKLVEVKGSSPRDAGTVMYVTDAALWGTIGGGQLEFLAINHARALLTNGKAAGHLDVPLGPEIGQCCGGHVRVSLRLMDARSKEIILDRSRQADADRPHVYIMGAGHVGRALTDQMQHLPVRCVLIDTRKDELAQCEAQVETRLSAIPESDIQSAPPGSAFVVLTHDHGLDFLLTSAALARRDAAYVGMIGSATKRSKFTRWCAQTDAEQDISALHCPIGSAGSPDKRPSVIAAFVAAEIIAELTTADMVKTASAAQETTTSVPPLPTREVPHVRPERYA